MAFIGANPYLYSGAGAAFSVRGIDLVGTNWMERDGDLTGNTDGPRLFGSVWIDPDNPTASQQLWSTGNNAILIRITGSEFNIIAENAAGTTILNMSQAGALAPVQSGWSHWIWNIDMASQANCWIRHDGTTLTNQFAAFATSGDVNIDFTQSDHGFGANPGAGGSAFDGGIGEFFLLRPAASIANDDATVLKFISQLNSAGVPVDLGATGTTPGLGTPIVWLTRRSDGSVADFVSNNGTGGGMTQKGTPTIADRGFIT